MEKDKRNRMYIIGEPGLKKNEIRACSYLYCTFVNNNELILFNGPNGLSKPYKAVSYHVASIYIELNNCENTFKT